jgi:hypothetical protein
MKGLVFLTTILTVLLVAACSNSNTEKPAEENLLFKHMEFPALVDSAYLAHADTSKPLGCMDVRQLMGNITEGKLTHGFKNAVDNFCKIDSIKKAGAYTAYVDSLDIGMTQDAHAYSLGRCRFMDTEVLLWILTETSYEACPASSSFMLNGAFKTPQGFISVPLGMNFRWVDPPSAFEWQITSELMKDHLKITSREISEDLDEASKTIKDTVIHVRITNGEIIMK